MHRVALFAGFVSVGLLAPSTSHACCADVSTTSPLGWSVDGRLLVGRHVSTMCSGTSVAEVLEPGERVATERYDLYSRSARIDLSAEGRAIDDETLYEEEEEGRSPNRYAPSAALRRRFSGRPTTLCATDVLGLAFPTHDRGVDRFDEEVLLSVRVRTETGFREVLSGVRRHRVTAQTMQVFVHPSPDGTRAFLRFRSDGPDAMFDDAHWIDLPADTIRSRDCGLEVGRPPIFPSTELGDGSYGEDLRWMVESANEALAAADGGSPAYFATEAAWTRPRDPSIRALLVRAVTRTYGPVLAAAIESEAPIAGAAIAIANDDAIVEIATTEPIDGRSSDTPPLSREEEEAFHGAPAAVEAEHALDPEALEPTLDLDVEYALAADPTPPDAGVHFEAPAASPEPMACAAASFDPAALLIVLLPLAFRRRRAA